MQAYVSTFQAYVKMTLVGEELNLTNDDMTSLIKTGKQTIIAVDENKFFQFGNSVEYSGYTKDYKINMYVEPLKPYRTSAMCKMRVTAIISCYSPSYRISDATTTKGPYPLTFQITNGHDKQNLIKQTLDKDSAESRSILFEDQNFRQWWYETRSVLAELPQNAYPFIRFSFPFRTAETYILNLFFLIALDKGLHIQSPFPHVYIPEDTKPYYLDRLFNQYIRSEIRDFVVVD